MVRIHGERREREVRLASEEWVGEDPSRKKGELRTRNLGKHPAKDSKQLQLQRRVESREGDETFVEDQGWLAGVTDAIWRPTSLLTITWAFPVAWTLERTRKLGLASFKTLLPTDCSRVGANACIYLCLLFRNLCNAHV